MEKRGPRVELQINGKARKFDVPESGAARARRSENKDLALLSNIPRVPGSG